MTAQKYLFLHNRSQTRGTFTTHPTKRLPSKRLRSSVSRDCGQSSAATTWKYCLDNSCPWVEALRPAAFYADGDGELERIPGRSVCRRRRRVCLDYIRAKMGSSLQRRFGLGWRTGRIQLASGFNSHRIYFLAGNGWVKQETWWSNGVWALFWRNMNKSRKFTLMTK